MRGSKRARVYLMGRLVMAAMCAALMSSAHAEQIYKWVDADGKVHFGDHSAAPEGTPPMEVKLPTSNGAPSSPQPALNPPSGAPAAPVPSTPVDASRVGPSCEGLANQILAVKAGTPWAALARQFNRECPGIAYECVTYRAHPENNKCTWVERTGNDMVRTRNYP